MPDNWGYVVAAYAAAAILLGAYWRSLTRRARQLDAQHIRRRRLAPGAGPARIEPTSQDSAP